MGASRRRRQTAAAPGQVAAPPLETTSRTAWLHWHHPLGAGLFASIAHLLIAAYNGKLFKTSGFALFNFQAHAFLSGHLDLVKLPRLVHDLSYFDGHFYLYWQPFPALLLTPFVAVFGINFSDFLFNAVLGGVNVALIATLLKRSSLAGLTPLTESQRGLMVLTFALGTAHLPLAVYGRVWFTAQVVGFACVALAYLATVSLDGTRACLAVGAALGCAALTRSHLVLAGLWPAALLLRRVWEKRRAEGTGPLMRSLAARSLALGLPVAAAVALVLTFNYLRFGDAMESGLRYQQMGDIFRENFERWGAFSLHYVPTNFFYQYVYYPFPPTRASLMGGGLFWLTPLFLAIFWAFKSPTNRWSPWTLAASALLVATPILLLMGTGFRQWGPRYTVDFTVPLILLAAGGIRHWPPWAIRAATALSVAQYIVGTVYFGTVVQ